MTEIQALPTYFDGYWMRSTLEARWAMTFREGGIRYEWEPGGYPLPNGGGYRPDFRLWEQNERAPPLWCEIKHGDIKVGPLWEALYKLERVMALLDERGLLLAGNPWPGEFWAFGIPKGGGAVLLLDPDTVFGRSQAELLPIFQRVRAERFDHWKRE